MSQHSPLPWTQRDDVSRIIDVAVVAADGAQIFPVASFGDDGVDKANAEFIVRACNNHESLVRTLDMVYEHLSTVGEAFYTPAYWPEGTTHAAIRLGLALGAVQAMRERLLAQAEVGYGET